MMHTPPAQPLACALRRALVTSLAIGSILTLAACGAVAVPPPEADATNPRCAEIIVSLPDTLLGLDRSETTAQSTAAWGHGESTIVLRCGVTPPPPTTDLCTTIAARNGKEIDWIVKEDGKRGIVHMTTYGREPAIDVTVPRSVAPDQPSAAAIELASLIAQVPQSGGRCLAFDDAQ
ncbi:hypothetical protein HMPREF1484_01855 [Dermabacter sp. HFH0086]|uniref:DUF3515 family protein n=1 Tax=Dermabacter TaxID=36739 RepID=UPI000353E394|nr:MULTISPECIES: DUF3515 family protein [Dermabacter]EPH14551.1 hypothetical protein HMPREF1484_01855 [Dermabacter sp. HFH0086]